MSEAAQRRAVSAGAVIAVHLALISAFMIAGYERSSVAPAGHEIEIVFRPPTGRAGPALPPAIAPELFAPVAPAAAAKAPPSINPSVPAAPALSGVGRALFGCDPMKLDKLSPEDRAACLRLHGKPHEQSVRMGPPPDPNSPFTKEIEERFREAVPINRPCPQGSYNDTHGLPCFDFTQKAPLFGGGR